MTLAAPLSPSEPPLPHWENAGLDHNCGFKLLSEVLRDFSPENPQGATWGVQEPPIIMAVGVDPTSMTIAQLPSNLHTEHEIFFIGPGLKINV